MEQMNDVVLSAMEKTMEEVREEPLVSPFVTIQWYIT